MNCVCFNLRRATRMVTQLFDGVLRPSGLRITQFTLMVAVSLRGSAPIQELAEILGMDRTTLTRNLKGPEEAGMVSSSAGTDRRSRLISLTPKGEQVLDETLPLWRQAQQRAVESLGEERLGNLMPVLHHISASSGQRRASAI
jgi:DNA-binding MarR family transcriptional regulator